ncbi:hypothetical protein [Peribacillus frigoritolerans]|uniref:hypothetical protein n=1 Tax=Peribacillus frigoritolerans TaxID=450367 RepID=UPI00315D4A59
MKFKFESAELEQEIEGLKEFCEIHFIHMHCFFDGEEFRLAEDDDDDDNEFLIDYDTQTKVYLPHSIHEIEPSPLSYILKIIDEAKNSTLIDDSKLISGNTALIRITSDKASVLHDFTDISTEIIISNKKFEIDMIDGISSFNIKIIAEEMFNKYFPPYYENDLFIQITSDHPIEEKDLKIIFDSYNFELKSTINLEISEDPWIYELWDDDEDHQDIDKSIKLRPLLYGNGVPELLALYNSSNNYSPPEQRILTYCRVIEYVSQTVIRKDLIEKTVTKLSSSRVLAPDANYILELGRIFEDHRGLKKDYLAFKITIGTCCDLHELVNYAPKFLKKTNKIKLESSADEQQKAFEEIASSISSTRNMFAHAKTNYEPKGDECPPDQLFEFSILIDKVAQQVIRWFSRQHEDTRII